jgi:prepilin-type N-terminal cleavage/methylation domain-containing protein
MTSSRAGQSGLTLLETMIALLLMAIIAAIFSGALGTSARVLVSSSALNTDLQDALGRRDLRALLERQLETTPPDDGRPLFMGNSDSLEALVVPSDPTFWPGVATLVAISSDASVTAIGRDAEGGEVSRTFRLAAEGYRINIAYWGRTQLDQAPAWHKEWPAGASPPDLVKIDFRGPGRPLPPLAIRPSKAFRQSEMSLSSLVPPALPSRP